MLTMANEKNYVKMVTPMGKAMYSKVNTVIDEFKGKRKYMINVIITDPKEEAKLKADITKLYEDAQKSPQYKGKEWRARPRLGWKTNKETGVTQFQFWTYAFDKDENQKTVPVFTKYGEVISQKSIGNGSDIKVSFTPSVYYESEDGNGVALYLNQIVVYNLIEYTGGATADFVFEEFVPDNTIPSEEIPF